ncbi:uncharacterized protein LOC143906805 [Temnothorax americanus]|uniref:uncharacterized protein LOC143906805 n=1 Tax=Temnothorax americanus TaxID=1964332 RepID=UPI004067CAF0
MVQCYVPNCKHRSDCQNWKQINVDKNRKITFHSIPKNDTSRNLWTDILGLPSYIPNTARICSAHFPREAFDDTNPLRIRLRPNVLPSILPNVMPTEVEERQEEDYLTCSLSTTDKATMAQPSMEDKTTMTSSVYNSPEKCRLQKQLLYQKEKYDKKIRGLQQTVRRRDKQVVTLKCILDTLQKKGILEAEQSEMLLNLV